MRRTVFGKSPERELLAPSRASIRDALLFDLADQQASADLTLAERRVESWTFAPWLLLAGHLIIGGQLARPAGRPIAGNACVGVPLSAGDRDRARSRRRDRAAVAGGAVQMAPHTVGRLMCGYIALSGCAVDLLRAWRRGQLPAQGSPLPHARDDDRHFSSGRRSRSVSPPLAIINAVVALGRGDLPISAARR